MKYKSYGFWTALAGAVTLFAGAIAKCFGLSINVAIIEDVIMTFAGILVVLGIVCMPIENEKNHEKSVGNEESSEIIDNKSTDNLDDQALGEMKENEESLDKSADNFAGEFKNDTAGVLADCESDKNCDL